MLHREGWAGVDWPPALPAPSHPSSPTDLSCLQAAGFTFMPLGEARGSIAQVSSHLLPGPCFLNNFSPERVPRPQPAAFTPYPSSFPNTSLWPGQPTLRSSVRVPSAGSGVFWLGLSLDSTLGRTQTRLMVHPCPSPLVPTWKVTVQTLLEHVQGWGAH